MRKPTWLLDMWGRLKTAFELFPNEWRSWITKRLLSLLLWIAFMIWGAIRDIDPWILVGLGLSSLAALVYFMSIVMNKIDSWRRARRSASPPHNKDELIKSFVELELAAQSLLYNRKLFKRIEVEHGGVERGSPIDIDVVTAEARYNNATASLAQQRQIAGGVLEHALQMDAFQIDTEIYVNKGSDIKIHKIARAAIAKIRRGY